jgi:hypothetical protein
MRWPLTIGVSVGPERSKLIATEILVDHPYVTLWSSKSITTGPNPDFPPFVIRTSEEVMKSFVADRGKSNTYPEVGT